MRARRYPCQCANAGSTRGRLRCLDGSTANRPTRQPRSPAFGVSSFLGSLGCIQLFSATVAVRRVSSGRCAWKSRRGVRRAHACPAPLAPAPCSGEMKRTSFVRPFSASSKTLWLITAVANIHASTIMDHAKYELTTEHCSIAV